MSVKGYARGSTKEQTATIKAQTGRILDYATAKNLDFTGMYMDEGVSGTVPFHNRPDGIRLLEDIEAGQVTAIILTAIDRGFRSIADACATIKYWNDCGIEVHIIDLGGNNVSSDTATGKLIISIMAALAEIERDMISKRNKDFAAYRKSIGGKYCRDAPYGYAFIGKGKRGKMCEEPNEQENIELVCMLYKEGNTVHEIVKFFNENKILNRNGKPRWYHGLVSKILARAGLRDIRERNGARFKKRIRPKDIGGARDNTIIGNGI